MSVGSIGALPRATVRTSGPDPSAKNAPKAGPTCSHRIACRRRQGQQEDSRCFGHQSCDCGIVAPAHTGHGACWSPGGSQNRKAQDTAGRTSSESAQRSGPLSQGTNSVKLPVHGSAQRAIPFGGAADLGGQRPQTAPHFDFQTHQRPPV